MIYTPPIDEFASSLLTTATIRALMLLLENARRSHRDPAPLVEITVRIDC